jgi:hypothetical protein
MTTTLIPTQNRLSRQDYFKTKHKTMRNASWIPDSCPFIDKVISVLEDGSKRLQELASDESNSNIESELNDIAYQLSCLHNSKRSDLEKIREINSDLRKFGEDKSEELIKLSRELAQYQ